MPASWEGVANPASWLHSECIASTESAASAQKATRWRVKNCHVRSRLEECFKMQKVKGWNTCHWAQYIFIKKADMKLIVTCRYMQKLNLASFAQAKAETSLGQQVLDRCTKTEWVRMGVNLKRISCGVMNGICQSAPTRCWTQSNLTFAIPNMLIRVTSCYVRNLACLLHCTLLIFVS